MIWTLKEIVNEIIADGPDIETPSGEIRVIDVDTAAALIKKLMINVGHGKNVEEDSLLIKDAEKFLEYLYA